VICAPASAVATGGASGVAATTGCVPASGAATSDALGNETDAPASEIGVPASEIGVPASEIGASANANGAGESGTLDVGANETPGDVVTARNGAEESATPDVEATVREPASACPRRPLVSAPCSPWIRHLFSRRPSRRQPIVMILIFISTFPCKRCRKYFDDLSMKAAKEDTDMRMMFPPWC